MEPKMRPKRSQSVNQPIFSLFTLSKSYYNLIKIKQSVSQSINSKSEEEAEEEDEEKEEEDWISTATNRKSIDRQINK